MPIHTLPQFWHPSFRYEVIAGYIFQKVCNFCKHLLHHRTQSQTCFHTLWKFQSSGNKSMYKYTLPNSSVLLLLSIELTNRLKSQTVTDWYTGTLQHIKKPNKTIKENHSQPFSCPVLPQDICHGHPYFLFSPTSETPIAPLLVPLTLISEGVCSHHYKM